MTPTPKKVIDRALSRVERQGDCIVSLYSAANHGYAQIGWNENKRTQMRLVHRVAWEAAHGLIPDGMTVDHLCHNRKCLRLEHLRLLSNVDNGRRNKLGRDFPVGWVCKNNHPASSQMQVMRRKGMGWTCRECLNESKKRWELRNRKALTEYRKRWVEKEIAGLTEDDPRHGRSFTYTQLRCRCDRCRDAQREYIQMLKAKKKAT